MNAPKVVLVPGDQWDREVDCHRGDLLACGIAQRIPGLDTVGQFGQADVLTTAESACAATAAAG